MARYFDIAKKLEWPRIPEDAPVPAGVVFLPPENVFWSPLPAGHELTFDGGGLPDGTQPIVKAQADQIADALVAAGITARAVSRALYLDGRGVPGPLNDIDTAVDGIAVTFSATVEDVMDGL